MGVCRHPGYRLLAGVVCALALTSVAAEESSPEPSPEPPLIALIIDDLGDRLDAGSRAIALPGQLTYAILPRTPYSRTLAQQAHEAGKEVMLHQPMQAINGKAMGPGGMDMAMSRRALLETLEANLASVPYARGINNHMGSLLTRHPGHMGWLMAALRERGNLYFIDSTTTAKTVAEQIAREHELPATHRNVFLDHHREEEQILGQFVRLLRLAHRNGQALGIGHPYPETLAVLEKVLPHIEELGVRLVPASALIAHKEKRREQLWQASLSPLPKGLKSSKR